MGDIDVVRDLCQGVAAVGKKPAQGYGIVERWDVEPWPHDWSVVRDGVLMRSVPVVDGELPDGVDGTGVDVETCRRRVYGLRPPYWRRENQTEVWMP